MEERYEEQARLGLWRATVIALLGAVAIVSFVYGIGSLLRFLS